MRQPVTLSPFAIGQTEVTQALWEAVMGSNPSYFNGDSQPGSPDHPVEQVTWEDCQEFITKLNEMTGRTFRLPSEAEWEFAARGGNYSHGYSYAGSDDVDQVAWYRQNSDRVTHPVAEKLPNELGLYDMSGNVWEWCQDWFGPYGSEPLVNPVGPESGTERVIRGGSYYWNDPAYCRVSCRMGSDPAPENHNNNYPIGLRLVMEDGTSEL